MNRSLSVSLFASILAAGFIAPPVLQAQTTVSAADVVINGESFFAASNIRDELNRLARTAGVIGPAESFRQVAVSGAVISQIIGYYRNANPKPTFVISDGGGNDLMGSCPGNVPTCPTVANTFGLVKDYFDTMAVNGTKKVLWMRYPDPQGSQWATLKANQDLFNPLVKNLCDTITTLTCLWVDLRPVWEGKYAQYTNDGIHATNAGGTATAEAFWKAIVDSNFFDLSPTGLRSASGGGAEAFGGRVSAWSAGRAGLVVRVSGPGAHAVSLHDPAGRTLALRRGPRASGEATYRFAEAARPGVYFVRVRSEGNEVIRKVVTER